MATSDNGQLLVLSGLRSPYRGKLGVFEKGGRGDGPDRLRRDRPLGPQGPDGHGGPPPRRSRLGPCRAWETIPPRRYAAIVTALYRRERTGRGGIAQTSLLQNGLWANGCFVQNRLFGEHVAHRPPRTEAPNALANHYRCRDGRWFLMALHNEPRQLASFLRAIGAEHLAQDPRFATQLARRQNHKALNAILDDVFAKRDLAEWRPILEAAGVTFGAVF